jgi:hypothetical protein
MEIQFPMRSVSIDISTENAAGTGVHPTPGCVGVLIALVGARADFSWSWVKSASL